MLNSRLLVLGQCAVLAVFIAGCGASDGPPKYSVSGTVTFDGTPVKEGQIIFAPVDGAGPDAGLIRDGKFSFQAKLGKKMVRVQSEREVPGQTRPDHRGGTVPLTEAYIPAKYDSATTLQAEVSKTTSKNQFKFDLLSQ